MNYNSPFNITFGEQPNNIIQRNNDFETITNVFNAVSPETKIMVITGPRGCGKTVLLSFVKQYYDKDENWITVDINPNDDILEQLAAKIYESGKVKRLFLKTEFNFSFKGIGFSLQGKEPISNVYALLDKIFIYLREKNIRVLITIDDISSNEYTKIFSHSYQSFLRERYNTFLLMTGLYENIDKLEKTTNLTFLARAPKIYLNKLNLRAITLSYMNIFNISEDEAFALAKQTNGYAYGYQLLGSILYKSNKTRIDDEVLNDYDVLLEDNCYLMIWDSLSTSEKKILFSIVRTDGSTSEVISDSGFNNSYIQVYKKKLIKKGILEDSTRGKLTFCLPRFKEFVEFRKRLEEE